MGCVGSKEDLDYDTLSKAVIEEEKRKIQQRQQQQQQQQHPKDDIRTLSPYQPEIVATTTNIPKHTLEPNGATRPTPAVLEARGKEEQAPQPERKSPRPVAADGKAPTPTPRKQRRGFAHHLRNVFARSFDDDQVSSFLAPYFDKSDADAEFLREAMSKNFLFSNLSERQWKTMIDAFEKVEYERGVEVVKQGEEEDHFFVVREGYLHFQIDGVKGDRLGPGECFGELALLYDSPRTASVISDFPSVLFRVDQKTFRCILQTQRELAEHDKKVLLAGVAFLKDLDDTDLSRLAEAMVPRRFAVGELLAAKGDPADTFFIIQEGKVRVTDFDAGHTKYQDHDLGPGDYFGETAMIKDEQRMANFRGKSKGIAISIDKSRFQELIGDFAELIHRGQDKKKLVSG
jgi:cAMP-dependent protein kinase regulator